jgi:predicted PurR-regulated permease PerM
MAENRDPTDRPPPTTVAPAEVPGVGGLLTLWIGVVVIASLFFAREVLIPITLSVLLSFVLAPLVNLFRVVRLGRVPSVMVAVVLGVGVIVGLAGLIGTQIAGLAGEVPAYQYTIEHKIETVRAATLGRISGIVNSLGRHFSSSATPEPAAPAQSNAGPKPVPVQVQQPPPSAMTLAENVLEPVVSPLATAGIVFIVSIFILLQREDLRDRLIRLFGSGDLHRTTLALDDAARRLSSYFITQLSINAAFGVVIGAGLAVIGVPSPILWGTLAMMLRFVPYIGVPLAALLPIALAAAVSPGWSMVIWAGLLFLICETITGQVIEPLLYSHSTGLSPLSVVVAAIFWTWLWGPIGLILSTPLTLCLVVLGRHVTRLEFLDVMLGDRPALTPVESFYQRMLAGDPDEALEQAELFLKERSLSEYYDEVALKGLQLAANDAARGTLTPAQAERIKAAVASLIEDLDDHSDESLEEREAEGERPRFWARLRGSAESDAPEEPAELAPGWSSEAPVLCIAGRGPLDEVIATMVAQLLRKHGIGARVLSHDSVSRNRILSLPVRDVEMVCLTYLDIVGVPANLRFLLRRVRNRLPTQTTLVGFWTANDATLRDERLHGQLGVDHVVTGFGEAVEICLAKARSKTDKAAAPAA